MNPSSQFPPDIRDFLSRYIRTVSHLELLLFLFDGRERAWSVAELTKEMRANDDLIAEQIKDLKDNVVLSETSSERYQFVRGKPEATEIVRKISEQYRSRRHAMITEIYNRQESAIRDLADAFLMKKGDK